MWGVLARVTCALAIAGCLDSHLVPCGELICPSEQACDLANQRCVSQQQVLACAGADEGAPCTVDTLPGACLGGACVLSYCGDGVKNGAEPCDGDDLGGQTCIDLHYTEPAGLRCTADCKLDTSLCLGACGDGIRNGGELCDGTDLGGATCKSVGFYDDAQALACSPLCTFDTSACTGFCGDGVVNGNELCDGAPPQTTCVALGFDAGVAGCENNRCAIDMTPCAHFGFVPEFVGVAATRGRAISGSSPKDVWIVGDVDPSTGTATTIHFDGTAWTVQPVPATVTVGLVAVMARAADDVWAVGGQHVIHWNGTAWSSVAAPAVTFTGVWARQANEAYFSVLSASGVYQLLGTSWTALAGGPVGASSIAGTAAGAVWATRSNAAWRWQSGTWTSYSLPAGYAIDHIAVLRDDAVWVIATGVFFADTSYVVARWNGASWQIHDLANGATAVVAMGDDDVWVAGGAAHFDGVGWIDGVQDVPFLLGTAGTELVGIDYGYDAHRFHGQIYADDLLFNPTAPTQVARAMWAGPADELFVVWNDGSVYRRAADTVVINSVAPGGSFAAVWGTAGNDVWAVGGDGKPYHFTTVWQQATVANTYPLVAVWGTSASDVWAVGNHGTVLHYGSGSWSNLDLPTTDNVLAVGGTAANDVWAMTETSSYEGRMWHCSGTTWSSVALPATDAITIPTGNTYYETASIVAFAPDDVFVTGAPGTVLRWNGTAWQTLPLATTDWAIRLAGSAPDDVFATTYRAGHDASMFHFSGAVWSPVRTPSTVNGGTVGSGKVGDHEVSARRIDLLYPDNVVRSLIRVRPWECKASETGLCGDQVDNDCNGAIDQADANCP